MMIAQNTAIWIQPLSVMSVSPALVLELLGTDQRIDEVDEDADRDESCQHIIDSHFAPHIFSQATV